MSLSLHGGPFNESPSDKRTCEQAVCQSARLKKDLPQRHFSTTVFFPSVSLFVSLMAVEFYQDIGLRFFVGLFGSGQYGWLRGVCFGVLTPWQCVCRSVHRIAEASGLSLTHHEEDVLKCESDGPAGPIIVHYWRIHWRARWIDAGLLKALPTAMAAVIYACLCPLGLYLHISSLRASVHPFPPHEGRLRCTLCCTGIIVISLLKTHCFTCSLASFYISAALSSKIYGWRFPHPSLNLMV